MGFRAPRLLHMMDPFVAVTLAPPPPNCSRIHCRQDPTHPEARKASTNPSLGDLEGGGKGVGGKTLVQAFGPIRA